MIHAYPVMGRQACVSVNGQKGECIIRIKKEGETINGR